MVEGVKKLPYPSMSVGEQIMNCSEKHIVHDVMDYAAVCAYDRMLKSSSICSPAIVAGMS